MERDTLKKKGISIHESWDGPVLLREDAPTVSKPLGFQFINDSEIGPDLS